MEKEQILDIIKSGVIHLGDDGMIRYANRAAREMLSLEDSQTWPKFESLGEFYPVGFWKQPLQLTDVMIKRNGEQIQFLASTHFTEQGVILCLDKEMAQIEDEFRFFIMDNMSEGVVLLDGVGSVLYINSAAKIMLGVGLHAGSSKLWTMRNLGEFSPGNFWENSVYKKEVLFRKGDDEVHLLVSTYHQSDKIILCLEEEKRETLRFIRQEAMATTDLEAMVGIAPELKKQAMILANSDLSFMITGESGTGKEVMARAVHYSSSRSKGPFVVIDCTALPEHLVESELFGYESGSFTGAKSDGRAGKFELADGGTILLDEISELPLAMQPKLLRILNDQMVMRIGARRPKIVNVRVIACTNRNLKEMVGKGLFREDLYFRLKGAVLHLPPLRERMKYLDELITVFLKKYGHGKNYCFSPIARTIIMNYRWPGNVRELEKMIQYVLVHDPDETIKDGYLPSDLLQGDVDLRTSKLKDLVKMHEKILVINALQANGYNVTATAKKLQLSRMGLSKKIERLGITHPNSLPAKRFPKRLARGNKASITIVEVTPTVVKPGDKIRICLNVTNTGRGPWLNICKSHRPSIKHSGQYLINVMWYDIDDKSQAGNVNALLPKQVKPGETIYVEDYIRVTIKPGKYYVIFSVALHGALSFLDKPLFSGAYNICNYPYVEITVE